MKTSETDLIRSISRQSYADFVREFWEVISGEDLQWNWHLDVICGELQEQAERMFAGLTRDHDTVFNVSPGTSKSSVTSILFPPWVWTRMPRAQFICASYAYPLALELSNKSRDVLKSEKYQECFPEVVIRNDQDTKGFFKLNTGGYRYAIGSGGSVIGFHAHFILIDDPVDPKKAVSVAELAAVNHWLKHELRGRKVSKTRTVTDYIMQRLHQDDPSAQKLKEKRVRHFCLPAETSYEVKPPELKKFYVDGLMDPTRMPRDFLEEERSPNGLGEYGYAGQYGQTPVPAGGGMFKTKRLRHGPVPEFVREVRYWDKAATHAGGAFTVGVRGGEDRIGRVWVTDVIRRQLDSYHRERLIKRTARRDGEKVIVGQEQEGGSGGKESAENTVRRLRGYRVRTVSPRGDKTVRADEFSVQVNGGNVWLPEQFWDEATQSWTGWAAEYVEELMHFPFSTFKDQVDASSGMLSCLNRAKRRVGAMRRRAAKKAGS